MPPPKAPHNVVILAAGAGRRLRTHTPKPLLRLAEKPLLAHVLHAAARLASARLIVVCPPDPAFAAAAKHLGATAITTQPHPLGTADALHHALPHLRPDAATLVLCADAPLVHPTTMRALVRQARQAPALLTFTAADPTGYGRILRDGAAVTRIVEERDATPAERAVTEVYAGAMALPTAALKNLLTRIHTDNRAKERYLTDIAALATADGMRVTAVRRSAAECAGVNTAADLEKAHRHLRRTRAAALLKRGIRLADATRIDIRGEVRAGRDIEIDINVILEGRVALGDNCRIGAHCILRDCRIGPHTTIAPFSHLDSTTVGAHCVIGPYARLRPGTALDDSARIGNFVEIKNSRLRRGVKAGHLAYLGDADIGADSNIGAGVITCNYDGVQKHRTHIGDNVFIGSDSQLIAPLRIGDGAYIAAGTTVTRPVSPDSLAIARPPQIEKKRRRPPPAADGAD